GDASDDHVRQRFPGNQLRHDTRYLSLDGSRPRVTSRPHSSIFMKTQSADVTGAGDRQPPIFV
ncbi:hypothetical protein, partial [Mycobacterium avium]|uniref:hypothetical protein n=1 Tax=Mycobacterium avium TaxID=1764 RepID=UPI001CA59F09